MRETTGDRIAPMSRPGSIEGAAALAVLIAIAQGIASIFALFALSNAATVPYGRGRDVPTIVWILLALSVALSVGLVWGAVAAWRGTSATVLKVIVPIVVGLAFADLFGGGFAIMPLLYIAGGLWLLWLLRRDQSVDYFRYSMN